ncbi:hypothetical protein [Herbaspirillum chlorophenolicum]|uniref:hypothetical protein n=1 Tax=Herbaspirillum chlorophenolicum TaxID=211589 RepID=UPI00067D6BF1|nr:hypothetical protein [Herbaspirillum chlorophenolicum]
MDQELQGQDQIAPQDNGTPADPAANDATGQEHAAPAAAPQPGEYESLLSSLTVGGTPAAAGEPPAAGQPRDPSGRFTSTAAPAAMASGQGAPAQPGQPPAQGQPPQGQQPTGQPPAAKTPEQEDAELLAGIQSERGRARVQQFISRAREAEGGLTAIREEVARAGLTAETFSQHLEFSRLANSNDPRDLQAAAQMLEETRADIYRRLGQDAPAIDVLAPHPDLAQRVANLEIPREVALEVARMRHAAAQNDAQRQAQLRQQQDTQRFQQDIAAAQASMESYVATRQHEVDHPARMRAVQEYFANPVNLQTFATTYQPHQWPAAMRMLYDNVRIAPVQQRAPAGAPISGRPAAAGRPALPANASGSDQIMRQIENMGLL